MQQADKRKSQPTSLKCLGCHDKHVHKQSQAAPLLNFLCVPTDTVIALHLIHGPE